jgi:hypothetical protein
MEPRNRIDSWAPRFKNTSSSAYGTEDASLISSGTRKTFDLILIKNGSAALFPLI